MNIHPIHTETDYKEALKKVSALVDKDPERGTPDGDMLEILGMLVAAYEAKHYPMESPDPLEAIKFRMEQQGLKPKDLGPMIGQINRVYEVLAGKRQLTLPMIRRLHQGLGIPAEVLIAESDGHFALAA
ncbi:type II toxin-antitoxin system HigA family antitoxin [Rhodoferax sp. WC2427]|uniref:helix-turn-helix domain-containing protein n=1 Tax=Rhodoferax sp. WC2427 TaxID=3234144 RepID=UPI003466CA02